MEHIGIDLGSRESQVYVRNGVGDIVEEKRCRTDSSDDTWENEHQGASYWRPARKPSGSRAGHGSRDMMCGWWRRPWSARWASARGDLKDDRRDARVLSEASCRIELPSVHIPSVVSQEVKAICVSGEALIKTRTQLVSRVRSYVQSRLGAAASEPHWNASHARSDAHCWRMPKGSPRTWIASSRCLRC